MLLRADPETKTITLLSFPRDLWVDVYCAPKPGQPAPAVTQDKINGAYSRCGSGGTLETVRHLTGLPVNYLITVNFHGFRQIVNEVGGVWMDVDRRYYNKNIGTAETGYADIDVQPGYQRLNATHALEFVRYRHFDSDFFRLARQQAFVRAFKQQVGQNSRTDLVRKLPGLVSAITKNVEVGVGGNNELSGKTVLSYALFAATLPPGHFFQSRLENLRDDAAYDVIADPADIQKAVNAFEHPDVEAPKVANAAALGRRLPRKAPPPARTAVTVLNGNGVAGAASRPRLPDGRPAERPPGGRAGAVVPLEGLLRPEEPGGEGRCRGAAEADFPGRRRAEADDAAAARARPRRDAPRRRGADLPRPDHPRARARGAEAAAGLRPRRPLRGRATAAAAAREDAVHADGADRARAVVHGRLVEAGPDVLGQEGQEGRAHGLPVGCERVLGRPADGLGRRARARRQELPPLPQGRTDVRLLLHGRQAPHGRPALARRDVLGREHAPRLAFERDDDRHREGSQAAPGGLTVGRCTTKFF